MSKIRIDILLVERGLVESRSKAQRLVMAGQVKVGGQVVPKPSTKFLQDAEVQVVKGPPYVSRGGDKLEAALRAFQIDVAGKICADVGASTGGFTDCLLQHRAEKVFAIDVGWGILHWKLRQDPRVEVMERTNARYVEVMPAAVDLVTVDVSFISLKILLPVVRKWLPSGGADVIALIKPQFEAGRAEVSRGQGVIKDPTIHRRVLLDILEFSHNSGYQVQGLIRSPLLGQKGNAEFLSYLVFPQVSANDLVPLVDKVIPDLDM